MAGDVAQVGRATLEPQGRELPIERLADGRLRLQIGRFSCHQMVVLHDAPP